MNSMRTLLALFICAIVLAGCTGKSAPSGASSSPSVSPEKAPLQGWVLDAAVAPIANATVSVHGTNETTSTDEAGKYQFSRLPLDTPLVVIVEATSFITSSKSITVPPDTHVVLNFSLAAVPIKEPYHNTVELHGQLSCQAYVVANGQEESQDCGALDASNNKPVLDFSMGPDVAGVVLELEWTQTVPTCDTLNMTVETINLGDQNRVLSASVGPSVLRAQIDHASALRFYSNGGFARVTVKAGADPNADENTAGHSVPFQQKFTVYATIFYIDPPSPTFSYVKAK